MNPTLPPAGPAPAPHEPTFHMVAVTDLRGRPGWPNWIWDGYVAGGAITLLTSQWKSGKTTLVSVLLSRMAAGGALAGRAVRAGRAVIVSEEPLWHWQNRNDRLGFGPNVGFLCRPFLGLPTMDQWQKLIASLEARRAAEGLDLVVIDPLASLLPVRSENDAGSMLEALYPLRQLTADGVGVMVLHHPSKQERAAGLAARGSGALSGFVDVLIEMNWVSRPTDDDRRRRLTAFSRFPNTPTRLVIELTADGTDYAEVEDVGPGIGLGHAALVRLLAEAPDGLTRQQLMERWPTDPRAPDGTTLWKWLDRALKHGTVARTGTGRRNEPFVYRLVVEDGNAS